MPNKNRFLKNIAPIPKYLMDFMHFDMAILRTLPSPRSCTLSSAFPLKEEIMLRRLSLFILIASLAICCSPKYFAPTQLNVYNYSMDAAKQGEQTAMKAFLQPYADSVNNSMNIFLANLDSTLTKSWPENSLGHFMTDAYLEMAGKKFGKQVDLAFMNTGGIRLNQMLPGPINKGQIYELMPFDNLMVLVEMDGVQLQGFLDHVAARGGWPVSGGSYTIANKKAINVLINGKTIIPTQNYTIATSDYVANGGDDSNVMKTLKQQNIGYLQRDALLEYTAQFGKQNKRIEKPTGERVIRTD
jgi:2',3'-cyclic-nucleotide 2'-phosphodiesterase (5'-nucleotidase family)